MRDHQEDDVRLVHCAVLYVFITVQKNFTFFSQTASRLYKAGIFFTIPSAIFFVNFPAPWWMEDSPAGILFTVERHEMKTKHEEDV